jgi:hypothetical protein
VADPVALSLLEKWFTEPNEQRRGWPQLDISGYGQARQRIDFLGCAQSGALIPYCAFLKFEREVARNRDLTQFAFGGGGLAGTKKQGWAFKRQNGRLADQYIKLLRQHQTEQFWEFLRIAILAHVPVLDAFMKYAFEVVARIAPERFEVMHGEVLKEAERLRHSGQGFNKDALQSNLAYIENIREGWLRGGVRARRRLPSARLPRGSVEELGKIAGPALAEFLRRRSRDAYMQFRDAVGEEVIERHRHIGRLAAPLAFMRYYDHYRCATTPVISWQLTYEEGVQEPKRELLAIDRPCHDARCQPYRELMFADPENELLWALIKAEFWVDYLPEEWEIELKEGQILRERGVRFFACETSAELPTGTPRQQELRALMAFARRLSPRRFEELRREVLGAKPGHLSSVVVELFREPAELGAAAPTPAEPSPAMGGAGAEATMTPSVPPSTPTPAAAGSAVDAPIR